MTDNFNVCCPSCHEAKVMFVGDIPPTNIFAGRVLEHHISGGGLYRCENCFLNFRYPILNKPQLDELYKNGAEENWQAQFSARKDWMIANEWLRSRVKAGSILDVGCFDGLFLEGLGDSYKKYGIEIHPAAIERAKERGINVIGTDWFSHSNSNLQFDVVVAFDVIEHVQDPAQFIKFLSKKVKDDGLIVISSGNTDASAWRFMGSKYWYCTLAEHISFINPNWCRRAATENGLSLELITFFSHGSRSVKSLMLGTMKNGIYRLFPSFSKWLRLKGFGGKHIGEKDELADHPPSWMGAKDHLIALLRKQ